MVRKNINLIPTSKASWCEWKGQAIYYTVLVGEREAKNVAWSYPHPTPPFASIENYIAFYPSPMDACFLTLLDLKDGACIPLFSVNGEKVQAQPGDFYGGWITSDLVGPFKGSPGTWGW